MSEQIKKIKKLLVANRGEIAIRVFRAATELGIRTTAIYTYEDRYSLHRYKADEAYQIGKEDQPLKPYLDVEAIINIAKREGVDAIHPGYGFLSENVAFVRACDAAGIIFVGPRPEVMEKLGDKVQAKKIAELAQVPIIESSKIALDSVDIAIEEAHRIGYPIMVKAVSGGGGRGMRVVRNNEQLKKAYIESRREALNAFGDETIFLEKYIENPRHIEVQILGDNYGNILHLHERDCSVQRRFQKVVEVAPAPNLPIETKNNLHGHAIRIAREVNYNNAGTVEFLVDDNGNIYFIEVNPRIQVEHTITEVITGVDLVRTQILIAEGNAIDSLQIRLYEQEDIKTNGFAVQCRLTTEDPQNNFKPDYGTIIAYRNATGFNIRLDEGSAYPGATVSPFFDSMLVKVTASGRTLKGACQRLHRALIEFRVRGVKTNKQFLEQVVLNKNFQEGKLNVGFIKDNEADLFTFKKRKDRATKVLLYLANVTVNGNSDVRYVDEDKTFAIPKIPDYDPFTKPKDGTKQLLNKLGPEGFAQWLKKQEKVQLTDTTFRDAHQSLLATRFRTQDMIKVARAYAQQHPQTFSMEVWGGATFDVAMRFLRECPWKRLKQFREAMPNLLLQMLLRGSNAVGYTAYPDNLVVKFIEKAAETGIDIFRIFDSLNWVENMRVSIDTVRSTGKIAEACICYTGDLLNPNEKKYTLDYYTNLAKQLEDAGAHIIAIKDMAGLLKPYAAQELIGALKNTISLPIHLHTHDTSSAQLATYIKSIEAGVDVVDVAMASMSGLTSQPNFNTLTEIINGQKRAPAYNINSLNQFSNYWEVVREYYYPFESGLKAGTAEVYQHEIPGGQYSNLRPQANSLGLGHRMEEIKEAYKEVNELFGNIVKVTPSSKVVGDLAMYMVANGLSAADVINGKRNISFPESTKKFMRGELGQPYQGFPKKLQKKVLGKEKPMTVRANAQLEPIDFDKGFNDFKERWGTGITFLDYLSYLLYPKVFENFQKHREVYGDVQVIPTIPFFYGMKEGQEITAEIDRGKTLLIKLLYVGSTDDEGYKKVYFNLNGQSRTVRVKDAFAKVEEVVHRKATEDNPNEVGAPLQGLLSKIFVKVGDKVKRNQPLFVIEAMKMETTISSMKAGKVKSIILGEGTMVESDDLVVVIE